MQVKSIAIISTFIKLPFVFKAYALSIFKWPLKTGLTISKYHPKLVIRLAYQILHNKRAFSYNMYNVAHSGYIINKDKTVCILIRWKPSEAG